MKPVVLIILDGFGIAPEHDGNAVADADMPHFREYISHYPAMTLLASGSAVGLSWGEMGNSEVGHTTIGAGRIFFQNLPRINAEIESGAFFENRVFLQAMEHAKKNKSTVHLMGLVSPGNVHASDEHCKALLTLCKKNKCTKVLVHAFMDGRDTIFNYGKNFIQDLEAFMKKEKIGRIASLSGRFWSMDRDNHWERIQETYQAIAEGEAKKIFDSAEEAIQASYDVQVYDEQMEPCVIVHGAEKHRVSKNDVVIFFNYRSDRARELTKAFVLPHFEQFPRTPIENLFFVTMTEYEKELPVHVAYSPVPIENCLAKVLSDAGKKQLHIAETEKFAHVTFFMNGLCDTIFAGEERIIIPSPRVVCYDKTPEMATPQIADTMIQEISRGTYDVIIANFANPDMVGHTGNEEATRLACQSVDVALGKIVDVVLPTGGVVLITADHGNAEEVKNIMTGEIDKEHSTNPVPFLVVGNMFEGLRAETGDVVAGDLSMTAPVGMLGDVAPTILKLLDIPIPPEMTGKPLV